MFRLQKITITKITITSGLMDKTKQYLTQKPQRRSFGSGLGSNESKRGHNRRSP